MPTAERKGVLLLLVAPRKYRLLLKPAVNRISNIIIGIHESRIWGENKKKTGLATSRPPVVARWLSSSCSSWVCRGHGDACPWFEPHPVCSCLLLLVATIVLLSFTSEFSYCKKMTLYYTVLYYIIRSTTAVSYTHLTLPTKA